jgi:hypothetical protein
MTLIGNSTIEKNSPAYVSAGVRYDRNGIQDLVGAQRTRSHKRHHGHTTRKFESVRAARRTHPRNA